MLTVTLVSLVLAIPLSSTVISATLYTRIVAITLLFAAALSYNSFSFSTYPYGDELDAGLGLYSGLIYATTTTVTITAFMQVSGALILLPWSSHLTNMSSDMSTYSLTEGGVGSRIPTIPEYPMIILFTTMGATFLLESADLVSMYLSIELQSFGVYILAAIYRDSESATNAGLKYFLLGALSSALILLGSALVYGYTGLTHLSDIYELISVSMNSYTGTYDSYTQVVILGFVIISIGLLFKVASAPFHYWAPDVYDGTPTIVTTWLTVMPKISIFVFLLSVYIGGDLAMITDHSYVASAPTNLILICAFLSLVIGTVVGLGQYRIKRILAYSTISHVGFLLLSLGIGSASLTYGEESVEAFLFYIVQYTLTNINAFFVLLAFGYVTYSSPHLSGQKMNNSTGYTSDIGYTSELMGQFRLNPVLGLSFAICLFSMAGVPPLVGFFAKYTVLYAAIHSGYMWLAIIAILASVVSAVYYLNIIRVIHFSNIENTSVDYGSHQPHPLTVLTATHSYIIASITLFIMFFAVNPTLILNSTSIMALSLYVT